MSPRLALVLALTAAACGGGTKNDGTGPKGGGDGAGGGADAELSYEPAKLDGLYFQPEGLDRPSMLLARKKITLDKQRAAYKKAKPDAKADEAVVLATMLYEAAMKDPDDARRTALIEEARTVLKEAEPGAEPKAKAIVDHNLACLAYEIGDIAGAIDALGKAIAASPDDALTPERKAYLAYYLVRGNQNAEAAAAIKGLTPSKDAPEVAYAIAWASWRTGDLPAARAGILAAAQGWRAKGYLPALRRDVLLFAGRTEMSVDEAVALADAFAEHSKDDPKTKDKDGALLATLLYTHQSFQAAGRIADGIELVDRIVKLKGLNAADIGKLRLEQANGARRLGKPAEMVAFAKQGVESVKACEKCDPKEIAEAHKLLFGWARLSNTYYATSQDERWYDAARELYALYLALPGGADASTVQTENMTLESNHARAKKGAGIHEKGALGYIIDGYQAQITACYEDVLQREPKLGGQLTLTLEVSDQGEVTGASTEPGAGQQGLAAVATCAVARARTWVFPMRTQPGVTRVTVPYVLQPQAGQ
jgi:hypothetical protein